MPHFDDALSSERPEVLQTLRVMLHGWRRPAASAPLLEARFGVPTVHAGAEPAPVAAPDAVDPAPRAELHSS